MNLFALLAVPKWDQIEASLPLWFLLAGIISALVGASRFLLPSVLRIEQHVDGAGES